MITHLFVLWRDRQDRTRHVIGHLWREGGEFRFAYQDDLTQAMSLGFRALPQFLELRTKSEPYTSRYLFSTFLQRLPRPDRSDYAKAMADLGVKAGDDPLEVLARGGGALMTDAIELAEFRADNDGLSAPLTFRLAGESFLPAASATLREGDPVELIREPQNTHDVNATVVLRQGGQKIGYVPRYYAKMIANVLDGGASVAGVAERRIPMPEDPRWVMRVWRGDSSPSRSS